MTYAVETRDSEIDGYGYYTRIKPIYYGISEYELFNNNPYIIL